MKKQKLSGALAGAAIVGALLTATGASASMPASPAGGTVAAAAEVHLVTGDVVTLRTDASGRQTAGIAKAHPRGIAGLFQTFNIGRDLFVVPESAAPYLGSTLDPSLFDVTRLAEHPQASLRIALTLPPGAGSVRLAGATVHQVDATHAVARFTTSSARAFGAALARQAQRDLARGGRRDGMFSGISRMSSSAGGKVHPSDCPAGPNTLTVKGIDWNGNPDNGDSFNIYNVDDDTICTTTVTFAAGQAQVDVPDGNYSLVSFFFDFNDASIYLVSIPQVSVTKDKTVTLDATTATSQISVATPKPAPQPVFIVEWARTDALGQFSSFTFISSDAYTFYAAPTAKAPSVGTLHLAVQIRAQSTGAKKPYEYDAKFSQDGTIGADQSYVVTKGSLAAIDSGYAADHDNNLQLDGRFAAYPWEAYLFVGDIQFTTPLQRTEYYAAGKDLSWERFEYTGWNPGTGITQGELDSSWEQVTPGDSRSEVWSGEPTHPRLFEQPIFPDFTVCPVCATSSNLDAIVFPFGDNSGLHRGYPDSPASGLDESQKWSIKADKTVIGQGTSFFQTSVPLDPNAKTYTLSYQTHRSSDTFLLSTDISTVWKVRADAPQTTLPDGWYCSTNGDTDCTVLPIMTNSYDLGADLLGQISSGDHQGTVTIGHLAGADINVKPKVSLSYDGGKTWSSAAVTGGSDGAFTITFTVPSKGQTDGFGAIRLNAKDGAGGSLAQTILRAFAVK